MNYTYCKVFFKKRKLKMQIELFGETYAVTGHISKLTLFLLGG